MARRAVVALTVMLAVLGVPAVAGAVETVAPVEVPEAVGIMGAVDPPPDPAGSPVAPVAEAVGLVLLVGGSVTAIRSWVSTKHTV